MFYTMGYNPVLCFVAQAVPALASESSSGCLLCHFDIPSPIFGRLVVVFEDNLSGTVRLSRLMLYILRPGLRICHFSKES